MSNEKNPGCLGYIGDDILPSYMGIGMNHYKSSSGVVEQSYVAESCLVCV